MKKFLGIFLLVFCFNSNLFCQEELNRSVIIFDLINLGDTDKDDSSVILEQGIKNNLRFGLENQGFLVIEDDIWRDILKTQRIDAADLVQGDKAVQIGALAKADIAISGFYKIYQKRILFGIKCYDVLSSRLAVSTLKLGRAGLSLTALINETISEVIPRIKEEIVPMTAVGDKIQKEVVVNESVRLTEVTEVGETIKVRLKSPDEGAEVYVAEDKLGVISSGGLLLKSKIGSTLRLAVKKAGYHTRDVEISVQDRDLEIPIAPLFKKTTIALDLRYSMFQFLGLGAGLRYYFVSDWTYISGLNYFYAQVGESALSKPVLHNDINISVGQYLLFKEDNPFRAGITAGFGGILTIFTQPEIPLYIDTYYDVMGIFLEWNLKDILFYYQFVFRYVSPLFDDHLLESGYINPMSGVVSFGACLKW